ncbi:ABC transporter permease subunit, partial [Phaeobacter italicus]|uniref:ABC transporter permease subunit n=1 Tax=Phaeobacter italicus TaxID=481446 RepID=UPI00248D8C15
MDSINPILLIASLMVASTPILLAALGEMVVEKAGVLNLGVEGMMITGAVVGFAIGVNSGSSVLGFACAALAILTTIGIIFSVAFETFRFFQKIPFTEFIFGSQWSPQTALRADQVAAQGAFGMIPLFTGTLLISAIAMLVAVPVGLLSAIYLSEYANKKVRGVVKPLLEMLAGIPTVVYGFFAALTVAPFISNFAASLGIDASSQSALAAGGVMGIMIIPFVSSLSDDVINAVPQTLRDGSLALGATQSETMKKVI